MAINTAEKIKVFAESRGLSNADIARAAGVTRSAVTKWFNGTSQPKAEIIARIADAYDEPVEFFIYDITHTKVGPFETEKTYEVAAGQGRINDDNGGEDREYSRVRICGDSMYPTLHDGDIVTVHHITENISPADFAIVKINGEESTCKHIDITDDGIWLRAENKEVFEDKFYSVQEVLTLPVTIIGVATEIISRKL